MRKPKKILIGIIVLVALLGLIANVYAEWVYCKNNFKNCTDGGCDSPTRADDCTLYNCKDGLNVVCDVPVI